MAGKSDGTVYINTRVDTKGFGKGVNTMEKQVSGLTGAIGKLGLAIAATFAVGKLISFGKEAIELGSDLQEVQNVVDVTFTTMSDKVNEFAQGAAEAAGLSETMAKKYVGTFGAMAKAFGFAEAESFDMATALTQLTGDVASFYNLTQDEAYTKLKSVFTGETESLKELGVVMTQNALDSFAMANGWGKTTAQMEEQEKVALRYAFVQKQLSAASGDFIRTQDSWANQMRILNLNFDSFKANIGQALINVFTPFLQILNQLVGKMAELSSKFVAFSELITGRGSSGGGSPGEALGEITDGYEEITDATKAAEKAQKGYTSSLDELNVVSKSVASESFGSIGIDWSSFDESISSGPLGEASDALEDMKLQVNELIERYPVLGHVIELISDSFGLVKKVVDDLWELLTTPFVENKEGIIGVLSTSSNFLVGVWDNAILAADDFVKKLTAVYDEHFAPVLEDMTQDTTVFVSDFCRWFEEDMGPVLDRWGEKITELREGPIGDLSTAITNLWGTIADNWGKYWDEIIAPAIDTFINETLPLLTPAIEEIGNFFIEAVAKAATALTYLTEQLEGFIEFMTGVFTLDVDQILQGIWDMIVNFINHILDAVNQAWENLISPLNNAIKIANIASAAAGSPLNIPEIPSIDLKFSPVSMGSFIPKNAEIERLKAEDRRMIEEKLNAERMNPSAVSSDNSRIMELLLQIAQNTRDTADKDIAIGDREIAKANLRGKQSLGFLGGALVTTVGGR